MCKLKTGLNGGFALCIVVTEFKQVDMPYLARVTRGGGVAVAGVIHGLARAVVTCQRCNMHVLLSSRSRL